MFGGGLVFVSCVQLLILYLVWRWFGSCFQLLIALRCILFGSCVQLLIALCGSCLVAAFRFLISFCCHLCGVGLVAVFRFGMLCVVAVW